MRKVEISRFQGWTLRWQAKSLDSKGHAVTGLGFTRRGAISDLRDRIKRREQCYKEPEVIEVDW